MRSSFFLEVQLRDMQVEKKNLMNYDFEGELSRNMLQEPFYLK